MHQNQTDTPSRARGSLLLLGMTASAIAFALLMLVVRMPIGYAPEWAWSPREPGERMALAPALVRVVALCVTLLATGLWARAKLGWRRAGVVLALLGLMALVVGLHVGLITAMPGGVALAVSSQFSPVSVEYFEAAYRMGDVRSDLQRYPETMRGAGYHVATHPPGAVLFYRVGIDVVRASPTLRGAITRIVEHSAGVRAADIGRMARGYPAAAQLPDGAIAAAAFMAVAPGILGALAVVPLFLLVRSMAGTSAGLASAALLATCPSLVLFGECLDQVILLLTMIGVALGCIGVQRRRPGWLVGAGGTLGLAAFTSFGALAACMVVGLFALMSGTPGEQRTASARRAVAQIAAMLAGLVVFTALMSLALSVNLWEVFMEGMAAHESATLGPQRSHVKWAFLNVWELMAFLGWPLSVLLVSRVRSAWRERAWVASPCMRVALAGLVTLVAIDALGLVRAEVGRIWLFLLPPLIVGAVYNAEESRADIARELVACAALQLVVSLVAAMALMPVVRPF